MGVMPVGPSEAMSAAAGEFMARRSSCIVVVAAGVEDGCDETLI
jgi:hypothetical protein